MSLDDRGQMPFDMVSIPPTPFLVHSETSPPEPRNKPMSRTAFCRDCDMN